MSSGCVGRCPAPARAGPEARHHTPAALLGRDAEYRAARGQRDLGWQPDPGDSALVFQIYRGLDSTSNRITRSELSRVGYEFRLITRIS